MLVFLMGKPSPERRRREGEKGSRFDLWRQSLSIAGLITKLRKLVKASALLKGRDGGGGGGRSVLGPGSSFLRLGKV